MSLRLATHYEWRMVFTDGGEHTLSLDQVDYRSMVAVLPLSL